VIVDVHLDGRPPRRFPQLGAGGQHAVERLGQGDLGLRVRGRRPFGRLDVLPECPPARIVPELSVA
jgi:hypothetical protein